MYQSETLSTIKTVLTFSNRLVDNLSAFGAVMLSTYITRDPQAQYYNMLSKELAKNMLNIIPVLKYTTRPMIRTGITYSVQ